MVKKNSIHSPKTGFGYLLGVQFKISDERCRCLIWESLPRLQTNLSPTIFTESLDKQLRKCRNRRHQYPDERGCMYGNMSLRSWMQLDMDFITPLPVYYSFLLLLHALYQNHSEAFLQLYCTWQQFVTMVNRLCQFTLEVHWLRGNATLECQG